MWTALLPSRAATSALPVISPAVSQKKDVATPARLDRTTTVATSSPQPHIQPILGPKAFTDQVKEVPQSGTALFSSRYANATSSIGRKPARKMAGIWSPTSPTVGPSVEVRQ
ncbi:UNVERIFIED_CONTAM: hypothetical protein RKD43_002896 [Streptomyces graminofaciens]